MNSAFEEAYVLNAAFDAGKSVEEVAEIFGAEFAKTYGDKLKSNNANISTKSDVAKDAEKDILERYLTPSKEDFVANPNWQDYSKALRNKILSPDNTLTNRGYYTTLLNQIDQVTDALSGIEYNSRDDVKDLYDKVKEKLDLDKKDKFKDFKLDVLKEMVELAEAHQKDKEKTLVLKEYNRLRKIDKKSRKEAIDTIQNSDEFKGSYFHDYWKKGFNEGLIHQIEDDKVRAEARKAVNNAIEAQRRQSVDTPRSSRQIEKDVRVDLKKDGELDKYTKSYLNGEMSLADRLVFERSSSKSLRKEIATDEKVEHRKTISYTANEIKDKLNNDLIFESLLQKGYITDRNQLNKENEPTYDLTVLSDKIRGRLGADLRANKQTSNLRPYSEVENVVKEILADSDLGKVSSSDAKKLIKLCGFEIEGKNWVKITANALLKTIPNGIGTAVGVGLGMTAQVYDKIHPLEVNVNNKVHAELNIKINGGDATIDKLSLMRSLVESGFKKENIQLIETEGGFKLIIDKLDSQSYNGEPLRFTEVMSKRLGETVLKTMMVNFALNFVQEAFADNQGEIPVATTQFQHKSIKGYCSFIDADRNMTKAQKESLKQLAEAYIQLDKNGHIVKDENGEPIWNVEDFKLCLDKIAGSESMLNKSEFYIGINAALRESNEKLAKMIIEAAKKDLKNLILMKLRQLRIKNLMKF